MRRLIAVPVLLTLLLVGCIGAPPDHHDEPSSAPTQSESQSESESDGQTIPDVAQDCVDHPLEDPAAAGDPFCTGFVVVEILDVEYDVDGPTVDGTPQFDEPDDPLWISVSFRTTSIVGPPELTTDQAAPTLTSTQEAIDRAPWLIEDGTIPSYDELEFRADYVIDRGSAEQDEIVLCIAYLSSPDATSGCGLIV